jgi:FMN phosphatase YigB (HAD superfamily)
VWLEESRTPACAEIVDSVLTALDVRLSSSAHARVVEAYEQMLLVLPPDPMPLAEETVRALAEQYRLAVICDTGYSPGSVLRKVLDRHGMLIHFDYLYFSNEHGMSKPDARVFERTLGKLGVSAREAAHVGDIQRTDIAGAQAAGMAAVHFLGANDYDARRSTADAVVRSFEELPAALETLPHPRRGRLWRRPLLPRRPGAARRR